MRKRHVGRQFNAEINSLTEWLPWIAESAKRYQTELASLTPPAKEVKQITDKAASQSNVLQTELGELQDHIQKMQRTLNTLQGRRITGPKFPPRNRKID